MRPTLSVFISTISVALILGLGIALGMILAVDPNIPAPYDRISSVLGWTYFVCWGFSFYPILVMNYQRKSVVGLSFDYILYNLLGFSCYSVFNAAFFWSDDIQQQYAARYGSNDNAVRINDVVFSLHVVVLTLLIIVQCFIYEKANQKVSRVTAVFSLGVAVVTVLFALVSYALPGSQDGKFFSTLNLVYMLSYVQLWVMFVKLIPQVVLNRKNQSTNGFPVLKVWMSFVGGLLSIAQLFLDSFATNDWSVIEGDPVKLGLGVVSIAFDFYLLIQHHVLYRHNRGDPKLAEDDSKYEAMTTTPNSNSTVLALA